MSGLVNHELDIDELLESVEYSPGIASVQGNSGVLDFESEIDAIFDEVEREQAELKSKVAAAKENLQFVDESVTYNGRTALPKSSAAVTLSANEGDQITSVGQKPATVAVEQPQPNGRKNKRDKKTKEQRDPPKVLPGCDIANEAPGSRDAAKKLSLVTTAVGENSEEENPTGPAVCEDSPVTASLNSAMTTPSAAVHANPKSTSYVVLSSDAPTKLELSGENKKWTGCLSGTGTPTGKVLSASAKDTSKCTESISGRHSSKKSTRGATTPVSMSVSPSRSYCFVVVSVVIALLSLAILALATCSVTNICDDIVSADTSGHLRVIQEESQDVVYRARTWAEQMLQLQRQDTADALLSLGQVYVLDKGIDEDLDCESTMVHEVERSDGADIVDGLNEMQREDIDTDVGNTVDIEVQDIDCADGFEGSSEREPDRGDAVKDSSSDATPESSGDENTTESDLLRSGDSVTAIVSGEIGVGDKNAAGQAEGFVDAAPARLDDDDWERNSEGERTDDKLSESALGNIDSSTGIATLPGMGPIDLFYSGMSANDRTGVPTVCDVLNSCGDELIEVDEYAPVEVEGAATAGVGTELDPDSVDANSGVEGNTDRRGAVDMTDDDSGRDEGGGLHDVTDAESSRPIIPASSGSQPVWRTVVVLPLLAAAFFLLSARWRGTRKSARDLVDEAGIIDSHSDAYSTTTKTVMASVQSSWDTPLHSRNRDDDSDLDEVSSTCGDTGSIVQGKEYRMKSMAITRDWNEAEAVDASGSHGPYRLPPGAGINYERKYMIQRWKHETGGIAEEENVLNPSTSMKLSLSVLSKE